MGLEQSKHGETGGFTSTFVIEHLVIHGGGDTREEVPTTPATEPSTPGMVSSGPTVVSTTLGRVPNAPIAEPRGLAVVPTTPRLVPSTPGAVLTTPVEQGTPSTPIEFTSPPSDITEFVDAFHDDTEVWLRRLDDVISGIGS